ncbi:MAG: TIR domain-containing protein [Fimbriimonadaceae bacterium]|nr:TIR domain-containing protein [Fimbriimonadaceae bacterium]
MSDYDAFISYKRSDCAGLATWLCHCLERWKPTKDLLAAVPDDLGQRLQQKRRVFLDKRFEVGNEDFWVAQIAPALAQSRHLVVLSSPAALSDLPDGSANWVEREIQMFFERVNRRERITVVLTPNAPENRLPGKLLTLSERWDWVDLRRWSPWTKLGLRGAGPVDDAVTKILAAILEVPAIFMPLVRQEEGRRRRRRRAAFVLILASVAGTMGLAGMITYNSVIEAREQKVSQQRAQSRRLANLSSQATSSGDAVTGILLALQAMPSEQEPIDTSIAQELWRPLRTALAEQRESILLRHGQPVRAVAFSPDGTHILTGSDDGKARIWMRNGTASPTVLDNKVEFSHVTSVAFDPDGSHVAIGSDDGTAVVWPFGSDEKPFVLDGHGGSVYSVFYSTDGTRLGTTSEDGVRIWPRNSLDPSLFITGHESFVYSGAFNKLGTRIVTGSDDGTARVWSADDGSQLNQFVPDYHVMSVAFSPDGTKIVTGSWEGIARVWQLGEAQEPLLLRGHIGPIWSVAFSSNGLHVATGSEDGTARIWRIDDGNDFQVLRGHDGPVYAVAFNPDGSEVVTGSGDGSARVWQVEPQGKPQILAEHGTAIETAAYGPTGDVLATGSADGTLRLWSASGSNISLLRTLLDNSKSNITSAAFSHDGKFIVAGSRDGNTHLLYLDQEHKPILLPAPDGIYSVAVSPNGKRFVTGCRDGFVRVYNVEDTDKPLVLKVNNGSVISVEFSPDGMQLLTTSSGGSTQLVTVDGNSKPIRLGDPKAYVRSSRFSPDGRRIVAISDAGALIWQSDGFRELLMLGSDRPRDKYGDIDDYTAVAVSPDGTRIATGSRSGLVKLWSSQGGEPLLALAGHDGEIRSLEFGPDGTHLLSVSWDDTARIWPLVGTFEEIVAYARALKLPRQLTEAQKSEYLVAGVKPLTTPSPHP